MKHFVRIVFCSVFGFLIFCAEAVAIDFVQIPPGQFIMGSPENESDRYDDEILHPVTISEGFEMSVTNVTQQQWVQVMGENPAFFSNKENCPHNHVVVSGIPTCPNFPVETVTWDQVHLFIRTLNLQNDGYTYSLPTEAQWEYAARANSQDMYNFGDDVAELIHHAWYRENSEGHPHDVATLQANAFGLYDMLGNISQMLADYYGPYDTESVIDPKGPTTGQFRVVRGGTWKYPARTSRCALRQYFDPAIHWINTIGFRLIRNKSE